MTRTSPPAQLAQTPAPCPPPASSVLGFESTSEQWRLGTHRNRHLARDGEWSIVRSCPSGGEVEAGWTWPLSSC